MKGDVQTHFQNTETDEGYFEIFFLFCPIWDQTIGDRYILKAFLPSASLLLLDKERVFVLSDVWGIFMTKNWVLKPEYGASLFFFLLSSSLWVMRFITCMTFQKKNHVLNSCYS